MGSFAKAPYWESMDMIPIQWGKIWNWFFVYRIVDASVQSIRLFTSQLLFAVPEYLIVSKDYCIKGTGGKEA